jgi:small subunit ribosomal protein S8
MTDPVSDFLTRLRNASKAGQAECASPHSNHSDGVDAQGHKTLVVKLKYVDGAPALTRVNRVSTPGRRLYYRYTEIPRVLNGLGIAILSTSKGLLKDQDCRRQKVGGELLCNVW